MDIITHVEGLVPGPGLYRMPAEVYHGDPAPQPSLSSSIAKILVSQSPEHAFVAHHRLSQTVEDEKDPTRPKEIGTVVHKLILGQGRDVVVIDGDDYRTAYAKSERKLAYQENKAPILRADMDKVEAMVAIALKRLAGIEDCDGFQGAPSEIVGIIQDKSGAWLRIMMDRFEDRGTSAIIWDVKTGEQSAAPQELARRIQSMNMELQRAFYVYVVERLLPRLAGRVTFRWVFIENEFPHAVTVAEMDATGAEIGVRKVSAAIGLWNRSIAASKWPGYPSKILRVDYPEWAEARWLEREERDPGLAGVPYDLSTSPNRPLDWGDAA